MLLRGATASNDDQGALLCRDLNSIFWKRDNFHENKGQHAAVDFYDSNFKHQALILQRITWHRLVVFLQLTRFIVETIVTQHGVIKR